MLGGRSCLFFEMAHQILLSDGWDPSRSFEASQIRLRFAVTFRHLGWFLDLARRMSLYAVA